METAVWDGHCYLVDHEQEVEDEHVDEDGGGAAQVLHQPSQPPNHCLKPTQQL